MAPYLAKCRVASICKILIFVVPGFVSVRPAWSQSDEAFVKIWNDSTTLTWDDFQAEVPYDPGYSAQSWTGVDFFGKCVDGKFSYEVTTIFRQDSSWVIGIRKTEELLRHEQGHFDIAEIYARKLRAALMAIEEPCLDVEATRHKIDQLVAVNQRELAAAQREYDQETENGGKKKPQKRWQASIAAQLQVLAHYLMTNERQE